MLVLSETYQQSLKLKNKASTLCLGDLILEMVRHVQKGLSASKFASKSGPYVVKEAYGSGFFHITKPGSEDLLPSVSPKWLKLYYPKKKRKRRNSSYSIITFVYIKTQKKKKRKKTRKAH